MQPKYEDLTDRELLILIAKSIIALNERLTELCNEKKECQERTKYLYFTLQCDSGENLGFSDLLK